MKSFHKIAACRLALGAALLFAGSAVVRAETAGAAIDDSTVTAQVKAGLLKDQSLKSFDIHVDTSQDVVHLTGTVANDVDKTDAARVAQGVAGVRSVQNDITVSSSQ